MDYASPMLPIAGEHEDLPAFELDNTALTDLIAFQKKHNPRLKDKTNRDIADMCGMSENTLCAILKGKNKNPRVGTLRLILGAIGGGSIDRLVGLAPHRDFAKEEAFYDATLVDAMQARLDEKRALIESLQGQLAESEQDRDRLRKLYNEKCIALSAAETRIEAMKAEVDEGAARRARWNKTEDELRKVRMLCILACLGLIIAMGVLIYLLWEIANPNLGNFRY